MVTILVYLVTTSSIASAVDDLVADFIGVQNDDDNDLDEEHFASIDIDVDSNSNPIKSSNFTFLHYNVWSLMADGKHTDNSANDPIQIASTLVDVMDKV